MITINHGCSNVAIRFINNALEPKIVRCARLNELNQNCAGQKFNTLRLKFDLLQTLLLFVCIFGRILNVIEKPIPSVMA